MECEDEISHAWERFMGGLLRELLPPKVEFGKILNSWRNHTWTLFIHKKEKLAHRTIILNVFDFLLHHITCGEITKDACDNFCATFVQHLHVGNKL
jgi:hypothetical protein